MKLNLQRPLVFFDLETTGVQITRDRIVEISIVKVHPDSERETKTRRINPGMPIPPEATAVHGITDADVADCPTFAQVARSLYTWLEGCDIAGFNSNRFDVPMLIEEFLRAGHTSSTAIRRWRMPTQPKPTPSPRSKYWKHSWIAIPKT